MHSGLHVGVIYHLVSWTLLHAPHNYTAIESSSNGRKGWLRRGKESEKLVMCYTPYYNTLFHLFLMVILGCKWNFFRLWIKKQKLYSTDYMICPRPHTSIRWHPYLTPDLLALAPGVLSLHQQLFLQVLICLCIFNAKSQYQGSNEWNKYKCYLQWLQFYK